jgi:hypothetical protein
MIKYSSYNIYIILNLYHFFMIYVKNKKIKIKIFLFLFLFLFFVFYFITFTFVHLVTYALVYINLQHDMED